MVTTDGVWTPELSPTGAEELVEKWDEQYPTGAPHRVVHMREVTDD